MKIIKGGKTLTSEALNAEIILNEKNRKIEEIKRQERFSEIDSHIEKIINLPTLIYVSDTAPLNPQDGDIWFKIIAQNNLPPFTDYLFRFDASELNLEDNQKVSRWSDLSINANDIIQNNVDYQPVFLKNGLNNKPTVQFNTSFLEKELFTLDNTKENTVFIVYQFEDISQSSTLIAVGTPDSSNKAYGLRFSNTAGGLTPIINSVNFPLAKIRNTSTSVILASFDFDGLMTRAYENSTNYDSKEYVGDIGIHNILRVGKNSYNSSSSSEWFKGKISEIIYFSKLLSDEDRVLMESFLMNKWLR